MTATGKTKAAKRAARELDARIEAIYYANAQRVQISILDIPKVFRAGHVAAAAGGDVEAAVIASIAALRINEPELGNF